MSFGMFCAIPQPVQLWDNSCANLVLPCMPLVGAAIGALWWGAARFLLLSGIHIMPAAAIIALTPFFASGFLHIDGFMDTSDAVLSRRPVEDKLRILKDPHTGAFAVIMTAALFILQFAFVYAITENNKLPLLLSIIPVISRCCSAFSILCLKTLPQSSFANMFRLDSGVTHKVFIVFMLITGLALSFLMADIHGLIVTGSVIAGFSISMCYAYSNLKGVSGDLAGFALVTGELCGLLALAVI